MISKTSTQYKEVISACQELFAKKTRDYGTAWRVLRLPSITDQIYIKAQRIRSIQDKGSQKVEDSIRDEFVAIVNYCVMALIQMKLDGNASLELTAEEVVPLYEAAVKETYELLENKNHELWRSLARDAGEFHHGHYSYEIVKSETN